MRSTQSVTVDAEPNVVFPYVASLDHYPAWLPLVHTVEPAPLGEGETGPAWMVEIRARVGPFARSKRLRMVRTTNLDDDRERRDEFRAEFERAELDGRDHARWALLAELTDGGDGSTTVTMHLAYDGTLWGGALLERVLDEEIRRGRAGLAELVSDATTH